MNKVIMGIDSSLSCTGYSILKKTGKTIKLIDCGKIMPDEKLTFEEKCAFILDELEKVITKNKHIDYIAIEQPNSFRNGKTVRALCGLYGVIRYFLKIRHNITLQEMNTIHIKKVVTGDHKAKKDKMVLKVNSLFKKNFIFKKTSDKSKTDEDICDAIGVAYTLLIDLAL